MSDGSTFPLVHIAEPGVGTYQKLVAAERLECRAHRGRGAAGSRPHICLASAPTWAGRVRAGGSCAQGRIRHPADRAQRRATITSIGKGPRGARVIRRTVRISDLGRELWEAANPPRGRGRQSPQTSHPGRLARGHPERPDGGDKVAGTVPQLPREGDPATYRPLLAKNIITPAAIMDSLLTGPMSDKFF